MTEVRGMADSHSLSVIASSLALVQDYLQRQSSGAMPSAEIPPVNRGLDLAHRVNRALLHLGIHVSRMSVHMDFMKAALRGYDPITKAIALGTLLEVQRHPGDFDGVYGALADQASRDVFDWVLSYRTGAALIGRNVEEVLPSPLSERRWTELLSAASRTFSGGFYHLEGLAMDSGLGEVVGTFLMRQYELSGAVEVEHGDVVLDCGAYRGETALWFAKLAGPTGRVIAFEPVSRHAAAVRRNALNNPGRDLAPVDTIESAVAGNGGRLRFNTMAEGSSRADSDGVETVSATTLDGAVKTLGLDRIDFIKMDIEGGEVDALKGAQATLKSYAPKLAISAYHKPRDLPDIVAAIRQARPDYRFYLSHKSLGLAETVLFARSDRGLSRG
jgi:FkbM family methyltransferase